VTFDIDANGILNVTARDEGSGKEQSISITGSSTLNDKEVDRMVKDAEENAAADKQKRERIDLRNEADSLVYQTEKQLADLGDKLPAAEKEKVEALNKDLKEALEGEDLNRIRSLKDQVQQALYAAGASVYQQAAGQAPGGAAPGQDPAAAAGAGAATGGASTGGDDVIDADFTETK
ncbi:MAG: Hsp70 family protein, partial [Synechococcus sp. SB0662_bin_45]|nr:Hsp70 family protein [Synechococcus sp. SB0662_bin_45]